MMLERCRIFKTEKCGVYVTVELAKDAIGDEWLNNPFIIIDGNFMDGEIHMYFNHFGALDKFLYELEMCVESHELAGGVDDIIDFLHSFKISHNNEYDNYVLM